MGEQSPEVVEEDMQIVDQVLGLNESDGLDQALVTQAHLLEETDINTVLSTIQVDEFSDFFTGKLFSIFSKCTKLILIVGFSESKW